MIHELYRAVNFLVVVALCLVICALQSVALKLTAFAWIELDLLLLVVVYLSLHRGFFEGGLLIIVIGRITEIHSGAPTGILTASYLAVFLAILLTKEFFLVATTFSSIILAVTGGLVWKLAFLVLAQRYGILGNTWRASLEFLLPCLLSLGVFSRPVFNLLRSIDQWTQVERESAARELTGEEF
jgi:cell shape-determining protein MreD